MPEVRRSSASTERRLSSGPTAFMGSGPFQTALLPFSSCMPLLKGLPSWMSAKNSTFTRRSSVSA